MSRSSIARLAEFEVKRNLLHKGFEQIDRQRVCLRINEGFLGWIGLNRGTIDGLLRVNPFVGVHAIPLMRAYFKARDERYVIGDTATIALHLGDIAPGVEQFVIPDESSVSAVALAIAEAIALHGVPFMREIANYEALVPRLEELAPRFGGNPEKLVLALHLLGRETEARAVLARTRKQLAGDTGPLGVSFEKFAMAFTSGKLG